MKNPPDSIYKEAWDTLAMCFGEQLNQEALDLMDGVLKATMADGEEQQNALQDETTEPIP